MIWPIPISEKTYIVTLHKQEDLEQFYNDMSDYHLVMKRPMSRNTHYKMTKEQAEELRQDPRVWDVQLSPKERGMEMIRDVLNDTPYNITGDYWKHTVTGTITQDDRQWGHIHCAGDVGQRGKTIFGRDGVNVLTNNSIDVFNDGKHVDVVICDDPVSDDCEEWFSPTTGQTRFISYDWYSNLNSLVLTIDDDGQTLPTGSYSNYFSNSVNTESHGTHVAGTVAGQHYGWAREANIYSMQVLGNDAGTGVPVPDLLIFDYLRAFHRSKPINTDTGMRNPTITNHSWSYGYPLDKILEKASLDLSDISSVNYRGTTYSSSSPNPSGWNFAGLEKDFGFAANKMRLNADDAAVRADIEDAIAEGIVIIGSAGNNNFHMVPDGDPDYNNTVTILGLGTVYYNRGSTPANSLNAINVGALSSYKNFRRSSYSNFGPLVDIFAPGDNIISSYGTSGFSDGKYGGSNYYQAISGTSMASPQVTGVIACLASYKPRFSQSDAKNYLDKINVLNDMTFDAQTGGNVPASTFNITVVNVGFAYQATSGSDRVGSVSGGGFTVTVYVGDTINFNMSNVSTIHPFFVRTSSNVNVSTPAATGQGATGNGTVSWTPNTAGSYRYICGAHSSMVGVITVNNQPSIQGTFADNTCKKGSPDKYLIAKNPRQDITGMIFKQVGSRNIGLTFPRASAFNRPAPAPQPKTFTLQVNNTGASSYVFNGNDRLTNHVDAADPPININLNDTIVFQFSIAGSHPFHVKTTQTTGTSNNVTSGTITNNGQQTLDLTWDTAGVTPGTYYYICRFHSGMSGTIIIS